MRRTRRSVSTAEKDKAVLFDGNGLDGWRQSGPGKFNLHDGVVTTEGGMGLLWNQNDYSDFKLTLEFKVASKQDNSGVFVRFTDPKDDPGIAIREGYEIQICDTEKDNPTGSIYGFQKSKEIATKPVGEWNKYEITVVGQKYTVKLNDKVVNEFTGNRSLHGHIGIQNHNTGSQVSFRNIRVVNLDIQAQKEKQAADKKAKKEAAPWEKMDYGSFISATIQAPWPADNYANKGIALRLGTTRTPPSFSMKICCATRLAGPAITSTGPTLPSIRATAPASPSRAMKYSAPRLWPVSGRQPI